MKVSIIGGANGSGKTTIILSLAQYLNAKGEKIGVIIQETGDVDYDEKTLSNLGIKTKEVNSVCIPCSLDTDIRSNLFALQEEFSPDTVFIETEETVLPHKLKADLERMKLQDTKLLPATVIINVPESEIKEDQLTQYARKQIEGAEIICINMIELDSNEHLTAVKELVTGINSTAKVLDCPVKIEGSSLEKMLS